jgi:hypothetical protein
MPFMSGVTALRRHGRQTFANSRGQAMVELALVLPIILLLVFGIVDLGRALGYKNDLTHLANDAARYAAVNGFPTGASGPNAIANYVDSTAPNELKNGSSTVTAATFTFSFPDDASGAFHCIGDSVKVTVTSHFKWLPFLQNFAGLPSPGSDMVSSSTMRLEQNYNTSPGANNAYTPAAVTADTRVPQHC